MKELEDKVLMLQNKIDSIISMLFHHTSEECLQEILEDRKDPFCPECCYTSNGVMDSGCGLTSCKRFEQMGPSNG